MHLGGCTRTPPIGRTIDRHTTEPGRRTKHYGSATTSEDTITGNLARRCSAHHNGTGTNAAASGRIGHGKGINAGCGYNNIRRSSPCAPPIGRTTGRRVQQNGLSATRNNTIAENGTNRRRADRYSSATDAAASVCVGDCDGIRRPERSP